MVHFGLLGPLLVQDDTGRTLPIRATRQRTVLAALLLHANRTVTADTLGDILWAGRKPPPRHHAALLNYLSRLRRDLGPGLRKRIETRPLGYAILIGDDTELDLRVLASLEERADAAMVAGDWAKARHYAGQALTLWRDEPLCDVPSARLHQEELPRLAETRLRLAQTAAEADLRAGRYDVAAGQLRELVRAHPLRERLHERLMLTLYLAGRRADALEVYQRAHRTLADELGVDPGQRLRDLHARILADDRLSAAASQAEAEAEASQPGEIFLPRPVPRQLPSSPAHFVGRAAELAALDSLFNEAGQPGVGAVYPVRIAAILGAAGIGKTALALHWAHQVADRFRDGQLYADLRGFSSSVRPALPGDIIREFLDALGVPPAQIPSGLDAQAALYRSLVAGRRLLIVLDNARDAAQVRSLLPGSPGCLTIVTSRRSLTSLVAAEGAHPLTLDLLTAAEAHEFLARRLGAARLAAEPAIATELITLCAELPLALSIAAAHAATRPALPLAALAAQLRSADSRLDVLDAGEPATSVRVVFSWSSHQLSLPAARLFRLLGLHPGPDISIPAAASLAGTSQDETGGGLRELALSSLITEHSPARFTIHDLLHDYAAEQARAHDSDAQRHAATRRLLDHYLHTAYAAARLLNPTRDPIGLAEPAPGTSPERLTDPGQAWAWYEAERPALLAAVTLAATESGPHAWQLPWTLDTYLNRRGHWQDRMTAQHTALAAAQRLEDKTGQAHAHDSLAATCIQLGRYRTARTHLHRALGLHEQLNAPTRQARTHLELSSLAERQGRHREALSHARRALALYQVAGHTSGYATALGAVGWCHALLGEHEPAVRHCLEALGMHRESGDTFGQAHTLDTLGYAHHHAGRHTQAVSCYREALTLFEDLGHQYNQASTLTHLGDTHHAAGEHAAARQAWRKALAILGSLHHPDVGQLKARLARLPQPIFMAPFPASACSPELAARCEGCRGPGLLVGADRVAGVVPRHAADRGTGQLHLLELRPVITQQPEGHREHVPVADRLVPRLVGGRANGLARGLVDLFTDRRSPEVALAARRGRVLFPAEVNPALEMNCRHEGVHAVPLRRLVHHLLRQREQGVERSAPLRPAALAHRPVGAAMPWMAAVNLHKPPVQLGLAERKAQGHPYGLRMRSRVPRVERCRRGQVMIGQDQPLVEQPGRILGHVLAPQCAPRLPCAADVECPAEQGRQRRSGPRRTPLIDPVRPVPDGTAQLIDIEEPVFGVVRRRQEVVQLLPLARCQLRGQTMGDLVAHQVVNPDLRHSVSVPAE